jgi:NAD(P)H-hydrate epimerase
MREFVTQFQFRDNNVTIESRSLSFLPGFGFATIPTMSVPVINIGQMREWENLTWVSGQSADEVIKQVGRRVARRARRLTQNDDKILVLAGKGNNGNDARAAIEHLDNRRVEQLDINSPEADLKRVELALRMKPDLIIDGMFGIGLNRTLSEAWQQIIAAVNASGVPVLSVDVPSGLNADTGGNFGASIKASVTLMIGAPKTGLLVPQAWPWSDRLELADDVGFASCPLKSELNWSLPSDFKRFPPARSIDGHKGEYGHLSIIAGSFGYHGAAVLAARAAQRAQPGLITLQTTGMETYTPVASQLQAVMVGIWQAQAKVPESVTGMVIGPGLAAVPNVEELKGAMRRFWRDIKAPVVIDASALHWLSPHTLAPGLVRVITPHPGEAAFLLNTSAAAIQADRQKAVREISRNYGNCWVVLKGNQTLIGRAKGDIFVNSSGNPHLAQGGSGDVLAGYLGGLLAQPRLAHDPEKTIRYAVWQHGAAADKLQATKSNWTVEDLVAELGNVTP